MINNMKTLVTAIIEKDGIVLGEGTNWHRDCKRMDSATGEDYDKCNGCIPHNHAEQRALRHVLNMYGSEDGYLDDCILHLYGHTYACEPCKKAIKDAELTLIIH
jgi:deoxycytidylate deaminase